jgi:glutamate synthase domain-containing protein 3
MEGTRAAAANREGTRDSTVRLKARGRARGRIGAMTTGMVVVATGTIAIQGGDIGSRGGVVRWL